MAIHRKAGQSKWEWIVALEGIKSICKLAMLCFSGGRLLIHPFLPERTVVLEGYAKENEGYRGFMANKSFAMLESMHIKKGLKASVSEYLTEHAASVPLLRPERIVPPLSKIELFQEVMHILRPLFYGIYIILFRLSSFGTKIGNERLETLAHIVVTRNLLAIERHQSFHFRFPVKARGIVGTY
ncbi:hypothetical protein ROZALSC1DRAFT_19931 [Rozella allomycis CSF55]|uniref:Peroxisomal membrane protein PEX16 n=1 Tax=Rozella allomycis (strain CSF55) TaxID=988480 RepID=A0A4P9YQP9_ROZAC|nr:hypothetical protein ROZALSC1DRAFT_19931 [Rozella allomycis CSF55]